MRYVVALVLLFVVLVRPASAFAEPAAPQVQLPQPTETVWYGYQTLAWDAATFTMAYMAGTYGSPALGYLSAASYVLSGPIVHAAHGRAGAAGASLLLRTGLPLGGAAIGFAVAGGSDGGWGAYAGVLFGGLGGVVTASLVDACALARQEVPAGPSIQLGVAPTRGGATLGAAGTF